MLPKHALSPGQKFGRLVVVDQYALPTVNGGRAWICLCECGNYTLLPGYKIYKRLTRSCGCLQRDVAAERTTVHGNFATHRSEYIAWDVMIRRCHDPKHGAYYRYGARGITVCEEWRNSFDRFLQDMGPKPSPTHSIDRVDNSRGYEAKNCRWATKKEQAWNRKTNTLVTHAGQTKPVSQWAYEVNMPPECLRNRLYYGWSVEDALTFPVDRANSMKLHRWGAREKVNENSGS